ncbi:MAG: GTP-binding protein, partial [Clostridia bacterium]|nr:GTP-binding protein [Clostridia bacterium]
MTKIDVFSGFLGAGKTTLIKKLIKEAYAGEKLVLIENEFGEIGVDGGFMKEAGIQVNELNSGCICCSLVGDFAEALKKVKDEYDPDRILIEPSGVGKLSDIVRAVERAQLEGCKINSLTAVVDANRCKVYMKNFGEFFNDQIESAACIIFSHVDVTSEDKLATALKLVRERNASA